jgi:hypothetical protein
MASVTRELFGGAITATLPADLVDASYVVQPLGQLSGDLG